MWYPTATTVGSTLLADLQALLGASDDVLAAQGDESTVVTIGENIRVERLGIATLVVVSQPPHTCTSCQDVIESSTRVLRKCKRFTRTCYIVDMLIAALTNELSLNCRACSDRWVGSIHTDERVGGVARYGIGVRI